VGRNGLATAALIALLVAGMAPFVDLDVWHAMSLFRDALRTGWVPDQDRFAYTPTVTPSLHHEWGAGAVAYAVAVATGLPGLHLLRLALLAAIAAVAVRVALLRGARPTVLQALAVLAIPMGWITFTLVRAQLYTVLGLAVLLACLEADRRGERRWIGPWLALWVLWVNLHAGFVVGGVFLAAHAAEQWWRGRPVRHLLATLAAMVALVSVNPYGLRYYPHLVHSLTADRSLIAEWAPLWASRPPAIALALVSMLVAAMALRRVGLREAPGWPLLALAAAAAVQSERHVSIYALVWLTQVPGLVSRTRLGDLLDRVQDRWGMLLWSVVLAAGLAFGLRMRPWDTPVDGVGDPRQAVTYPVGPVDYLERERVTGNLFVPFELGAYVSWKTDGRVKVSLDSRFEAAYAPGLLAEHLAFLGAAPGWRDMLSRYPHDLILVARDAPVAAPLSAEPGWTQVYQDDGFRLFARDGIHLPVVDRRGERIAGTFP
jgi:hypothetical protein